MQKYREAPGEFVSIERLITHIRSHPLSDGRFIPLIIWGGAGIGKTQQIKAYAKKHDLAMKTYHPAHDVSGADIVGQPILDETTGKTAYAWPDWLPTNADKPGILFIDEINRAPEPVLAGLMEVLGEGTISQSGWELPNGWQIVIAANPSEVGYQVKQLDNALVDRGLHYTPGWNATVWTAWARSVGMSENVIAFTLANAANGIISLGESTVSYEVDQKLKATPRSMEYFDALYDPEMTLGLLYVVASGLLGLNAAKHFMDNHSSKLALTLDDISPPYDYDDVVGSFETKLDTATPDRARATVISITAHLIDQRVPKNLADLTEQQRKDVTSISRFLAKLSSNSRAEAFKYLEKSVPEWKPVLEVASQNWVRRLAAEGNLIEQR